MEATIQIKPRNPNSRWVALDINNKIISEGLKPEDVQTAAKKTHSVFFLMYVPKKNTIFVKSKRGLEPPNASLLFAVVG